MVLRLAFFCSYEHYRIDELSRGNSRFTQFFIVFSLLLWFHPFLFVPLSFILPYCFDCFHVIHFFVLLFTCLYSFFPIWLPGCQISWYLWNLNFWTANLVNITAFRLWRRAVWPKYWSVLETVADAVYGTVYFVLKTEAMGFSETLLKFYVPARPCIPEDGNQLPFSVTALVSLWSALAMAIVCWRLVLTWVISARLLYWRRLGRLFSPLMPIYVVFSCIMYQETGDPPWAGPFSLQIILIQQKVLWQPLCVADCFLHIVHLSALRMWCNPTSSMQ
jgi:hypothetical protein